MKRLWLDDVRPAPLGWDHVRTAAEAIAALESGEYDEVSLDHDLGFTFSESLDLVAGGCLANQADADGRTGYDVACWIEERAAEGNLVLYEMKCHSANPVGRRRIECALASARWFMDRLAALDRLVDRTAGGSTR